MSLNKTQYLHVTSLLLQINRLQKLPLNVIKDATSISENELFNIYFDPILSSIISDPERNTLLR